MSRYKTETHWVLKALIQSISSLKSPGPDLAPGSPPAAFTDKDMPTIRDGFISNSESITFPLHVGKYRSRGTWKFQHKQTDIKQWLVTHSNHSV